MRGLHSRTQRATAVVVVAALGTGLGLWLASGSSAATYRWTTVATADVTQTLDSYGTITPVNQAAVAFPVSGTVKSVAVKVGDKVSAGSVLAGLDTTSLQSTLDLARSTLATAQNKLTTDTAAQAAGTTVSSGGATTSAVRTGVTAVLTADRTTPGAGAVTAAQQKILADQQTLDALLVTLDADVRGGNSTCSGLITTLRGLVPTQPVATPSAGAPAGGTSSVPDTTACTTLLAKVVTDEQAVTSAQQTLTTDETALDAAVTAALAGSQPTPTPTPTPTSTPTPTPAPTRTPKPAPSSSAPSGGGSSGGSGSGFSGTGGGGGTSSGSGSSGGSGGGGGGGSLVTAQQLVVDQATVDADAAAVTVAEQSLKQAILLSPLSGTVAAVAVKPSGTATARTTAITVIGPGNDQVTTTVGDLALGQVKIGADATVVPDGSSKAVTGKVTAIGLLPTSSTSTSTTTSGTTTSGTTATSATASTSASYPVTISLDTGGLYSGSGGNVSIVVKRSSHVLSVPTSAVTSIGTRHVVTVLRNGKATTTVVEVGATDAVHTQVTSGLKAGDRVALARMNASLPSSTGTLSNRGGFAGVGGTGTGGARTGTGGTRQAG